MNQWFAQMFEDDTDPSTPLFHETVAWLKARKVDLSPPDLELPEPSIGVKILELKREVALKTDTVLMPVIAAE